MIVYSSSSDAYNFFHLLSFHKNPKETVPVLVQYGFHRHTGNSYRFPYGLAYEASFDDVEPLQEAGITLSSLLPSLINDLQGIGERRIGEGKGGRSRHGSRHIGHAVMDHPIHSVSRIIVIGRRESSRCSPPDPRPRRQRLFLPSSLRSSVG